MVVNECRNKSLLFLESLLSNLGLLSFSGLGCGGLDDTDSNGLPLATDSEPTQRWELKGGLDTHGLAGLQLHDSGITRLDELEVVLGGLTGATVNLLLDLSKLKCSVKISERL